MNAPGRRAACVRARSDSTLRVSAPPTIAPSARNESAMSKKILRYLSSADPVLGGVIEAWGPCRMEADVGPPFKVLTRAIAHQQLNGTAANTILTRFIAACGDGDSPPLQAVLAVGLESLRAAGFSFAKIAAVRDLAAKTLEGIVPDRETLMSLPDDEIIERLTQVHGIGRWTVEMMLIFQLGRADV